MLWNKLPCRCRAFSCAATSVLLCLVATAAHGQTTFYSDWASFNAVKPRTALVDFEVGVIVNPLTGAGFEGPLDSTSDNGVFSIRPACIC